MEQRARQLGHRCLPDNSLHIRRTRWLKTDKEPINLDADGKKSPSKPIPKDLNVGDVWDDSLGKKDISEWAQYLNKKRVPRGLSEDRQLTSKIPNTLYHLTTYDAKILREIQTQGLSPKAAGSGGGMSAQTATQGNSEFVSRDKSLGCIYLGTYPGVGFQFITQQSIAESQVLLRIDLPDSFKTAYCRFGSLVTSGKDQQGTTVCAFGAILPKWIKVKTGPKSWTKLEELKIPDKNSDIKEKAKFKKGVLLPVPKDIMSYDVEETDFLPDGKSLFDDDDDDVTDDDSF